MFTRSAAVALLMWSVARTTAAADDLESLDEDFLSYLAEFEGDEDDWTIVEPAPASAAAKPVNEPKPKPPARTQAAPPSTSQSQKPATPDDGSKR